MDTLVFAYYCSGHGYGHATRVSAFTRHLLSLRLNRRLTIHIVSSAPRHVFADSIACGALYRHAEIDPVIVQPLAYRVDRQKSIQVLEDFLGKKNAMLDRECKWLIETGVNCVLSDAAFLACLAAKTAAIPSILITNFTFDSVYSYLATSFVDTPSLLPATPSNSTLSSSTSTTTDASLSSTNSEQSFPDEPIPESVLQPLVSQLHLGYQHADLLLRLPGHIPIPSFFIQPALPSPQWVNPDLNKFYEHVAQHLLSPLDASSQLLLHALKPFSNSGITIPRSVRAAPLLVRPPSFGIYTPEGRARFLKKTGLPDFEGMKILVVSFGGQVFKRPGSRTNSRIQSRNPSQEVLALTNQPSSLDIRPQQDVKEFQTKRSSCGFHKNSASWDKIALKLVDINARTTNEHALHLDLEAIDKGLRTQNNSELSDTARQTTFHRRSSSTRQPNRNSYYSDENASDYISSDPDNGNSSPQDSDPELSDSTAFFSLNSSGGAATAKRRHTLPRRRHHSHDLNAHRRLATPSHLLIPGAPPASKPASTVLRTPTSGKASAVNEEQDGVDAFETCVVPPTPRPGARNGMFSPASNLSGKVDCFRESMDSLDSFSNESSELQSSTQDSGEEDNSVGLLPDEKWIAVICGVSKEQWNAENEEGGLPEGFYVAPRDVYMPDLIAVGDVVLGKLGYGMTSECVDACTPFVYVSRPLFIEEHGLRMYLDQEGVGVELSRAEYEGGEWARSVEEAYYKGWEKKEEKKRKELDFYLRLKQMDEEGVESGDERRLSERERQGREMARGVVEWVDSAWKILGKKRNGKTLDILDDGGVQDIAPVEGEVRGAAVA